MVKLGPTTPHNWPENHARTGGRRAQRAPCDPLTRTRGAAGARATAGVATNRPRNASASGATTPATTPPSLRQHPATPQPPPPWRPRGGAPGRSTHPRDAPTFAKQALTLAVGQGGASFAEGHARSPPSRTSARGKGEDIEHSRCVSRVRGSMLLPARPKSPEGTGSPPLRRPRAKVKSPGVACWATPRGSNKPSGVRHRRGRNGEDA